MHLHVIVNFYLSFVSTSLAYITIPNQKEKQKLPEKKINYNIYNIHRNKHGNKEWMGIKEKIKITFKPI